MTRSRSAATAICETSCAVFRTAEPTCFPPRYPIAFSSPGWYGTSHVAVNLAPRSVLFLPSDVPFKVSSASSHEEYTLTRRGRVSWPFQFQSAATSNQCHLLHDCRLGFSSNDGVGGVTKIESWFSFHSASL